jgi:penicillin amidase
MVSIASSIIGQVAWVAADGGFRSEIRGFSSSGTPLYGTGPAAATRDSGQRLFTNPARFPKLAAAEGAPTHMKKLLLFALLGLVGLTAMVAAGAAAWVWTTLPAVKGTFDVAGPEAPVDVIRDRAGVPHIFAKSGADAAFALGFVHAQDRFWQMEMMRRQGAGRLAEVLGADALPSDKWVRTLGLYKLAEKQFQDSSPEVRQTLTLYAAGVNAWLDRVRQSVLGVPALEFALLRLKPEPWKPADSLVWGKLMAMRLGGNWQDEVLRTRLARKLAPQRVGELWPLYPEGAPQTIEKLAALTGDIDLAKLAAAGTDPIGLPRGASNAWVVNRQLTTTRGSILANDPHLALSAPILWYLAAIEAPDLRVVGATVPGLPFIILGHNNHIAWGITNTQTDIQDLFVEQTDGDGKRYLTPDGPKPFETMTETVAVKGASPVALVIRRTRHGPVMSDISGAIGKAGGKDAVMALSATFLLPKDTTAEALYKLNRAENWDTFVAALRNWHAPQSNFMFADTAGNIGFIAPGLVPVRRKGWGLVPSPGWDGETDWTGFLPFDQLPKLYNPASGMIVNANNRITPDDYPHFITFDWAPSYRAERIIERVKALPQSTQSSAQIQLDNISEMARDLLPLMLEVQPADATSKSVRARLEKWNGAMSRNRAEPLIFATWLLELNRAIYADELGELFQDYLDFRPAFIQSVLTNHKEWCDDVRTPEKEDCPGRILVALKKTADKLAAQHGPNSKDWQWGKVHVAYFANPVLGQLPWLGSKARIEMPTDGGNYTVNRGAVRANDPAHPFRHVHGAGLRAVYDLTDLKKSRFVIATGQSENPFSAHYQDMLDDWRLGRYKNIGQAAAALRESKEPVLVLKPAPVAR